jgi:hypothetical protein
MGAYGKDNIYGFGRLNLSLACAYTISPASNTVAPGAGSGSANVTAGPECPWTASTNSASWDWIAITSGWNGTGSGAANYMVLPNYTGTSRSGYLTIAGQTFTINQLSLTPPIAGLPFSGL